MAVYDYKAYLKRTGLLDLKGLCRTCCDKLESIGIHIPIENMRELTISTRMTGSLGKCIYSTKDGWFKIRLSFLLFGNDVPLEQVENTMIHELLHAVTQGDHHGGMWLQYANKVKRELGYDIQRCASREEYFAFPSSKYQCRCKKCGKVVGRDRWSDFVANPGNYIHGGGCGGRFERV